MSELLTNNLSLVTSSSNGVSKLRQLILQLAVMGKLVPQDPNDEPASELLKRFCIGDKMLNQRKKAKSVRFTEISDAKQLFQLPQGWLWIRLGAVANTNTGYAFKSSEYSNSGTFVLRVTNIHQDGSIKNDDAKYIDDELVAEKYAKFILSEGDVLLVMVGGSLGKIGIVRGFNLPAVLNQNMWKISSSGALNTEFLIYCMKFIQRTQLKITKSTHGHLVQDEYLSKAIPLPPLAEQHRIVAKVDELMALCDRLEAQQKDSEAAHKLLVKELLNALIKDANQSDFATSWQRVKDNFDALFTTEESVDVLKETILQLAVMGKLVPQDPNDEPASELLRQIRVEKVRQSSAGIIRAEKPLPPVLKEHQPHAIPSSWQWSRIGDYTLFTEYGISEKTFETKDGIPVIKMGNIQTGKVLLEGLKKVPKKTEVVLLQRNDLLYNRTNSAELVGKTGIFEGPDNEYTFASYLIRIRCLGGKSNPSFLNLAMNCPQFRHTQINPHLKQQCGQANVNGTVLRNMIIPVPPLAEQHRIVGKVYELMALCDELKEKIRSAQSLQVTLSTCLIENSIARGKVEGELKNEEKVLARH